jgi:hydrogenase nickel incorporation protein HypA/HybF
MHEYSLCQAIKKIIQQRLIDLPAAKVQAVYLQVGELACIDALALQRAFPIVVQNSQLMTAKLVIETIAGCAQCLQCANIYTLANWYTACPQCGAYVRELTAGDECHIDRIEVV